MKKLLLYSHDTFGMGNIRRMLALSDYLIETSPDISILLVTGSAVVPNLQLPKRLDYIKLPCLTRTASDVYSAKTLGTGIDETMRLRADLILAAAVHFKPDVVLVDKKPCGVKRELTRTLEYLKTTSKARIALILRDILDSPERTIPAWREQQYSERIQAFYDQVLVLGTPEIFDPRFEYQLPPTVTSKMIFCGYLGKRTCPESRSVIRKQLGILPDERLVLVTPGGGEDGHPIVKAYCDALGQMQRAAKIRSLIVTGPEMPEAERRMLSATTFGDSRVECRTFVDNMMACMEAADLVVSMGGYNTVCEILSTGKTAVIVPRVEPVKEQWIRAEKMARLGLFSVVHPQQLTPDTLAAAILKALSTRTHDGNVSDRVDMNALANVARCTRRLLNGFYAQRSDLASEPIARGA
jgi:predicted glycosyltransferase